MSVPKMESQLKYPRLVYGQPALLLAPMDGVIDAPMRELLTSTGAFTLCVSEFLRVSNTIPSDGVFSCKIPELFHEGRTKSGCPVQLQVLGGDPEKVAGTALRASQLGVPGIDLNFGCPAKTVNRHKGGAYLLKYPKKIREIVEAVRKAVLPQCPISVKLRLGWDNKDDIHQIADFAAEAGASWITVHARTRGQGFSPPVCWEPVKKVRRRLCLPVVANGDIWTVEDLLRCQDLTGCEHFMLGRGAVADPLVSLKMGRALGLNIQLEPLIHEFPQGGRPEDWLPLLRRFVELSQVFSNQSESSYLIKRIKQWIRMADLHGKVDWFGRIKRMDTVDEIFSKLLPQA